MNYPSGRYGSTRLLGGSTASARRKGQGRATPARTRGTGQLLHEMRLFKCAPRWAQRNGPRRIRRGTVRGARWHRRRIRDTVAAAILHESHAGAVEDTNIVAAAPTPGRTIATTAPRCATELLMSTRERSSKATPATLANLAAAQVFAREVPCELVLPRNSRLSERSAGASWERARRRGVVLTPGLVDQVYGATWPAT